MKAKSSAVRLLYIQRVDRLKQEKKQALVTLKNVRLQLRKAEAAEAILTRQLDATMDATMAKQPNPCNIVTPIRSVPACELEVVGLAITTRAPDPALECCNSDVEDPPLEVTPVKSETGAETSPFKNWARSILESVNMKSLEAGAGEENEMLEQRRVVVVRRAAEDKCANVRRGSEQCGAVVVVRRSVEKVLGLHKDEEQPEHELMEDAEEDADWVEAVVNCMAGANQLYAYSRGAEASEDDGEAAAESGQDRRRRVHRSEAPCAVSRGAPRRRSWLSTLPASVRPVQQEEHEEEGLKKRKAEGQEANESKTPLSALKSKTAKVPRCGASPPVRQICLVQPSEITLEHPVQRKRTKKAGSLPLAPDIAPAAEGNTTQSSPAQESPIEEKKEESEAEEVCGACQEGGELLLCDGPSCDAGFHLGCCVPPLKKVPRSKWFCPTCAPLCKPGKASKRGAKATPAVEDSTAPAENAPTRTARRRTSLLPAAPPPAEESEPSTSARSGEVEHIKETEIQAPGESEKDPTAVKAAKQVRRRRDSLPSAAQDPKQAKEVAAKMKVSRRRNSVASAPNSKTTLSSGTSTSPHGAKNKNNDISSPSDRGEVTISLVEKMLTSPPSILRVKSISPEQGKGSMENLLTDIAKKENNKRRISWAPAMEQFRIFDKANAPAAAATDVHDSKSKEGIAEEDCEPCEDSSSPPAVQKGRKRVCTGVPAPKGLPPQPERRSTRSRK
mmetsp:Transcript_20110/g.27840  ORF Transcript_20110/g.27840 Transcript_20110/m.27840 type:complete len:730 (+) Transcript_20110:3-2192(+)